MLNPLAAHCAPLMMIATLGLVGCSREAPPAATLAAGEAVDAATLHWAREALVRNPELEVVATDPNGTFTVRMRQGGELRTIRMDELIAAPPAEAPGGEVQGAPGVESGPDASATETATPAAPPADAITVTRADGRVNISGPGVSIASADASGARGAQAEPRRAQPIVCQGGRLLRIDNRTIEFDGDGLIVEDGCDLYLTNSRVRASGTAITVTRGKVHIVNSDVQGGRGSIDASEGSQVFLSDTAIDGLQRRFDTAQIHDLGGNRYR